MAVRRFTRASSEYIQFTLGAMPTMGPATAVAILKKISDGNNLEYILYASNNADPDNWQFYMSSSSDNKLGLWTGTAESKQSGTVLAADGWVMVAVTKATGTVAPIFYKCVLSTDTWSYTGGQTGSASIANAGTMFTRNVVGASNDHSGGFANFQIAALAVWGSVRSEAQLQAIRPSQYANMDALVTGWLATTPATMWRFDQSTVSAVNDLTAGGANQNAINGTTVVNGDDPPFAVATTRRRVDHTAWLMQVLEA